MRVSVMVFSLFAALVMVEHAALPLRLGTLAGRAVRFDEAAVGVGFFTSWALAAALVYVFPAAAIWLFAGAGLIGIFGGLALTYPVLVIWGGLATLLAGVSSLARREKQAEDQLATRRARQDQATLLTLHHIHDTCQLPATATGPVGPTTSAPTTSVEPGVSVAGLAPLVLDDAHHVDARYTTVEPWPDPARNRPDR